MRAQDYDEKYNGVQARLLQTVQGAMYVHSKSHCLILAIVHSCNDVSVLNVMSTVQEVTFAKKLQAFFDELDTGATTKEHMGKGQNYEPCV
jgi:phage FluMu gp28-like protein